MSDTNRHIEAEEVTVSEAKSIPEIAAEYGRTLEACPRLKTEDIPTTSRL